MGASADYHLRTEQIRAAAGKGLHHYAGSGDIDSLEKRADILAQEEKMSFLAALSELTRG